MAARHRTVWSTAPSKPGYWDPIDASIDWCEANYAQSPYIAEWWNTISNLVFMALIAFSARKCIQQRLGPRYLLSYALLMSVAVGSFFFHLTLRFGWQLADELPMLCTATQALCILLETSQRGQPSKGGRVLPFALTAFLCLVSGIYIIWQDPVFHQVAYAAILLSAVGRVTYLLHHRLRQTPFEFQRNLLVKGLCRLGVFFFALAFIIWNLDNLLCNRLQPYKDAWGLPLAYLLEGHAHWHLFTGIAAILLVSACHILDLSLKDGAEAYQMRWSYGIPWIERTLVKEA